MAITGLEYLVLSVLRSYNLIPPKPKVLELGESNWYGDVPVEELARDIQTKIEDPARRNALMVDLREILGANRKSILYEIARICLRASLDYSTYSAIDPGTPSAAFRFDLNAPVPLADQFDVTVNIGTAEHIFNVHQFFKTAHERTVDGGLMLHSSPFTGWPDHGFYAFQPTFFYDLARANRYKLILCICGSIEPLRVVQIKNHEEVPALIQAGKILPNSHLAVVFRKASEPQPFSIPIQAYYAGMLNVRSKQAWHDLR